MNRPATTSAIAASRARRALYGRCTGWTELRILSAGKGGPIRGRHWHTLDNAGEQAWLDDGATANKAGLQLHWGVCTRQEQDGPTGTWKGGAEQCFELPAVWVDLDFDKLPEAECRARLDALEDDGKAPPSIVVHSGHGLHAYWLLQTPYLLRGAKERDRATRVLKALAARLGGDPQACDIAHTMRVPGSMNRKEDPARPVRVELCDPNQRYTLDTLATLCNADDTPSRPTRGELLAQASTDERHADKATRVAAYIATIDPAIEGQGGDAHTFGVCCRVVRGFDLTDDEALQALRPWNATCVDPWPEKTLLGKIKSARKYGDEPIGGRLQEPRPTPQAAMKMPPAAPALPAPSPEAIDAAIAVAIKRLPAPAPDGRRVIERIPGGGWAYVFVDAGIRVEARYLRSDHGQLHAEVDVRTDLPGATRHKGSLSCAYYNLSSLAARRALARDCAKRANTGDAFDWVAAIESACIEIIMAARDDGEAPIVLDDAPEVIERDHDVCGLQIPADATSMLIAHGDSLKSYLALLVLGTLAQRGHAVLYLDWEWSGDRHRRRKQRLFGPARLDGLHYMKCRAPLVIEADRIRRYCDEHGITFIAVDSVGLACDGPLKDDDVAVRFHRALGSIRPALCVAHVPKSTLGGDVKADAVTPFGSVFFSNLSRMAWSVKKQPGATDDVVTVGCFPAKQNEGPRLKPTGFEFTFSGDTIAVQSVDLATVDGLADKLSLADRMAAMLKAGPQTIIAMAEALDAKPDTIEKALKRATTKFTRLPPTEPERVFRWGLLERPSA